jgi:hypothetical protein
MIDFDPRKRCMPMLLQYTPEPNFRYDGYRTDSAARFSL